MAPEPAIMTAGWPEVAGHLARTGIFQEDQLNPEAAPRILADLVRRYTIIIGYGAEGRLAPIGSGTYVKRTDGQHGILTAGHVIGAIKARENILVLPAQDRELVNWIWIEGAGMAGRGEANQGPLGPDVGWMPLSGEEVETMEALGAVFRNRARPRDAFEGEVFQIGIIFGFVQAASDLGENMVVAHGMLIGRTAEQAADEDGWGFGEYAITSDDPWIPRTHGGVSGSAVWIIQLPMDGSARRALILQGIVFAEGPQEDRKLITHGENSVRIALDEI